jgi:hypothetical protein
LGRSSWQRNHDLRGLTDEGSASAADANRELQKVHPGGTAFLNIWRRDQEIFLTLKKD